MLYVNQNKLEHMIKLHKHSEVVQTILNVVSDKLFDVVRNDKMGWTSIMAKDGGIKPTLCVHTDTVNDIHPDKILKDGDVWRNANLTKLLGADDRAGCYIIKELLTRNHTGYNYLIFDWEEVGGIGSSNYSRTDAALLDIERTSCYIGLDRLGALEMALYGAESAEFIDAVGMEDWVMSEGSFTDASNLAYAMNRCCVNLSVGYNNEHTRHETLNLSYLGVTLNKLANGLNDELYMKVYEPDYLYAYEDDIDKDDMYYTYTGENGRDWSVPVSERGDENLDHLPPDYWEGKELT